MIVPATHSFLTPCPPLPGEEKSSTESAIATYIYRLASASSRPGHERRPKPKTYSRTSRLRDDVGACRAKEEVGCFEEVDGLEGEGEEEEEDGGGRNRSGRKSCGASYTSGSCE